MVLENSATYPRARVYMLVCVYTYMHINDTLF